MIKQVLRLNVFVLVVQGFVLGFMMKNLVTEFHYTTLIGFVGVLISAVFAYWATIWMVEKRL